MATHTLQQMAQGGMYDQIGGGFHRYSVDEFWHIPHFEKMLYDNPQLASSYLDAFALTGDRQFAEVARGVLDYLMRDMTHPQGGIFSAEVSKMTYLFNLPIQLFITESVQTVGMCLGYASLKMTDCCLVSVSFDLVLIDKILMV